LAQNNGELAFEPVVNFCEVWERFYVEIPDITLPSTRYGLIYIHRVGKFSLHKIPFLDHTLLIGTIVTLKFFNREVACLHVLEDKVVSLLFSAQIRNEIESLGFVWVFAENLEIDMKAFFILSNVMGIKSSWMTWRPHPSGPPNRNFFLRHGIISSFHFRH
jgi:hypothetical protein